MARAYLDNNATTPVHPEAAAAVEEALRVHGNPSSAHASGRAARALLAGAREAVAALLGVPPREVVFTSGGTEADNLGVLGGARAAAASGAGRRVVTTAVEHPAVEEACAALAEEGFEVVRVPPGPDGVVEADALAAAVGPGTALVAAILVQNETGAILPLREAFAGARRRAPRAHLHADAVQALGRIPVRPADLGADSVALSAHKIHGPKGIGALWVREGASLLPRTRGGKQERGLRTGTENVPGAAGFGAAARAALRDAEARAGALARQGARLEAALRGVPGARLNGPGAPRRVPSTLNLSFDGVRGDLLLVALDADGIEVSTGSACASGAALPSPILRAMGLDDARARGAVRFSIGALTRDDEIDAACEAVPRAVARLRAQAPAARGARGDPTTGGALP